MSKTACESEELPNVEEFDSPGEKGFEDGRGDSFLTAQSQSRERAAGSQRVAGVVGSPEGRDTSRLQSAAADWWGKLARAESGKPEPKFETVNLLENPHAHWTP